MADDQLDEVIAIVTALKNRAEAAERERDEELEATKKLRQDYADLEADLAAAERCEAALSEALKHIEPILRQMYSWTGLSTDTKLRLGKALERARAALLASEQKCICKRFGDLPEGTIIADLTCPIHGVGGTDPGDVLPAASPPPEDAGDGK